jgi:hypothetical protein
VLHRLGDSSQISHIRKKQIDKMKMSKYCAAIIVGIVAVDFDGVVVKSFDSDTDAKYSSAANMSVWLCHAFPLVDNISTDASSVPAALRPPYTYTSPANANLMGMYNTFLHICIYRH